MAPEIWTQTKINGIATIIRAALAYVGPGAPNAALEEDIRNRLKSFPHPNLRIEEDLKGLNVPPVIDICLRDLGTGGNLNALLALRQKVFHSERSEREMLLDADIPTPSTATESYGSSRRITSSTDWDTGGSSNKNPVRPGNWSGEVSSLFCHRLFLKISSLQGHTEFPFEQTETNKCSLIKCSW